MAVASFFFAQFGLLELRDLPTRIRVYFWFDNFTIVYGNTIWSHILQILNFCRLEGLEELKVWL